MGHTVTPKVFLIGETQVNGSGMQALLAHLGVPNWMSDAPTDIETLIEVNGRACYKSFGTELNPNITRVRDKNSDYLTNVIQKGDGSILEHATVNFFFADVSRVFTHELVRHRVGTAMSQESLRFVRLDDLNWYAPTCIQESPEAMIIFTQTMENLSALQVNMASLFDLDNMDFETKKKYTSAMRRLAPIGLATNIGWSSNMRTLRHVIEMRTHPSAEEEIRWVFGEVAAQCVKRWPNLFADYVYDVVDGLPHYYTSNRKV